ncbi:unnamed protein product [Blepharisma stoltei]|uniref:RBR-type E3 ubiquitin transferase n=1 Tax=Blepharisma stoltei TaxID=1481888 RepID=A0AAU9IXN9_9CILI|nr:unnamed protein product [Blepharisma stoltei]
MEYLARLLRSLHAPLKKIFNSHILEDEIIDPPPSLSRGTSLDKILIDASRTLGFKELIEDELPLKDHDIQTYDFFAEDQKIINDREEAAKEEQKNEIDGLFGMGLFDDDVEIKAPAPAPIQKPAVEDEEECLAYFFADLDVLEDVAYNPEQIKLQQKKREILEICREFAYYNAEIDQPVVKCPICMSKQSDFIKLDCSDIFCLACINLVLVNYLDTGKVFAEEIACPECKAMIPDTIVNKHITADQQQKIKDLRVSLKAQKLVAEGKAIHCPVPDCKGFGYIFPEDLVTACSECKAGVCIPCKRGSHPGLTCEEYEKVNPEENLNDMLLSRNWKRCPNCGSAVEREDGCNFITCTSPVCRGEKALCNLCGKSLVEAQHFSHFQKEGPFGTTCNTLDGIPEPSFESSTPQNAEPEFDLFE